MYIPELVFMKNWGKKNIHLPSNPGPPIVVASDRCKFGAFDAGLEAGMEAFEDLTWTIA